MARLRTGEHQQLQQKICRILQCHRWGIKESEIAQELGLHRRTVNNYLRETSTRTKCNERRLALVCSLNHKKTFVIFQLFAILEI